MCIRDRYKVTERDSEGNPIKATGTMTADSVVSVQLAVYYSSWFGDSLNAVSYTHLDVYKRQGLFHVGIGGLSAGYSYKGSTHFPNIEQRRTDFIKNCISSVPEELRKQQGLSLIHI